MHHSASPEHVRHDATLIAAHAAGDASINQATEAAALVASCSACAELHHDLAAIATATRALPRAMRAPRDYRLTADQAARLRQGSWLRSALRPFGSRRSSSRHLAPAFTSLGLAGILVTLLIPGLIGGAASAPDRERAATAQQVGSGAAPEIAGGVPGAMGAAGAPTDATAVKAGGSGATTATDDADVEMALGATPDSANDNAGGGRTSSQQPSAPQATSNPNVVLVGSVATLLVGLLLFGMRFAARRLR